MWCGIADHSSDQRDLPRPKPVPVGPPAVTQIFVEHWGAEVESPRTSLASRTHFEFLGLGLEPRRSSPWLRCLKFSKIALSSTRGQHYFSNRRNFVGKRRKPRGKFANNFFVFRNWSIGLAKWTSPLN